MDSVAYVGVPPTTFVGESMYARDMFGAGWLPSLDTTMNLVVRRRRR
jgi:hypothetical protein